MRLVVTLTLLTLGLVACGSTEPRPVIDPSTNPAWQPPGQGDLAVADKPEAPVKVKKLRARALQEPNHADIPSNALASRQGPTNR